VRINIVSKKILSVFGGNRTESEINKQALIAQVLESQASSILEANTLERAP